MGLLIERLENSIVMSPELKWAGGTGRAVFIEFSLEQSVNRAIERKWQALGQLDAEPVHQPKAARTLHEQVKLPS